MSKKKHIDRLDLSDGESLQSLMDLLNKKGIFDMSKVSIKMDTESWPSVSCSCEDAYCGCNSAYNYGPSIYSDIRI